MASGLTWAQLRDLKCEALEGAADGWGRSSNRADAARDRVEQQLLTGLRDTQEGEAAQAAVARLRQLGRNFQYVYTECGLLRTTLNSLAHEMKTQQRALREALDDAAALKFTVQADGSVTYPAAGRHSSRWIAPAWTSPRSLTPSPHRTARPTRASTPSPAPTSARPSGPQAPLTPSGRP